MKIKVIDLTTEKFKSVCDDWLRNELSQTRRHYCFLLSQSKHNDYINHAVAGGLTDVALKYNKPVIFGVLTPNDYQQALDRAGGIHGNKGDEAAITAIKMLGLK